MLAARPIAYNARITRYRRERPLTIGGHAIEPTHEELLRAVRYLPEDYYPYGQNMDREGDPDMDLARMSDAEREAYFERVQDRYRGDCSCGCRWYVMLPGKVGMDWGVCYNPASHRCGLLTFEHQGCPQFEADPDE